MTDKEKLEKIKSLSDKMYTSMQNLTTDTAPIRKAMNEYHQFIIQHWHEKEPVSEDLEEAAKEAELIANKIMIGVQSNKYHTNIYNMLRNDFNHGHLKKAAEDGFNAGVNWKEQQI